ncbi:M18 family aminopeptidase [Neptunomonas japonica]|uniref:M18 family aminopeptidase n=1 Tax=Neptunomonas japonica JAMM 1380 TaxID=1441457 RepID=A0A7R6PT95_9GAMM|nr:M18 family aminopeptidase [Neptunomonas japonica]BBB29053.1 aspartyl aminopeptidase [Neptunomonas japonica JAMM 1380]
MSKKNKTLKQLISFLNASPTPFHAVQQMTSRLVESGYQILNEEDSWQLEAGGRYAVTRNDSSIIAWRMPEDRSLSESGFRMIGAHTDSPCLRVKPNPEIHKHGYYQLGVEVYGGVLLAPWFDRDLSLAGRVSFVNGEGELTSALINFETPMAVIPSLAIHLDREANSGRAINAQTFLPPLLGQSDKKPDFRELLKTQLEKSGESVSRVLDYELSLYDTQSAALIGLEQEFIASARLDNLLSCFMGLDALLESDSGEGVLLVCSDHEEVGSMSAAGAQGPMLEQLLERLQPEAENRSKMLARSMMISADNAHGIHPNFADKHDANHGPILNKGPVIKINANQRYATSDITSSKFRMLAVVDNVPVQEFVVRSDMGCGSTIGPITSAEIGVKTLDIGVPQLAMHSIRELAGSEDLVNTIRVFSRFFQLRTV